jgi:hypothetical protein
MSLGDQVAYDLGYKAAFREFMRAANMLESRLGIPPGGTAWGSKPFGGEPMGKLAIFYSPPIAVLGGEFYPDRAAEVFARYDVVIFPGQVPLAGITGIENPSNAFYASSLEVLQNIRLINPKTRVYGYIPMDIPYSHLTETQIQTSVNQCRDFGYDGIFWDTCGAEFGNTRSRQNNCVAMAHAATNSRRPTGMLSILNGFDPHDIYNSDVNTSLTPASYPPGAPGDAGGLEINPTGAAPLVYPDDGILVESFAVNTDPSAAPYGWANGYQNMITLFNKQYWCSVYRSSSLNIKVFAVAVMPPTTLTPYTTKDAEFYANYVMALAAMFSIDFIGFGTQNYGGADQIIPVFPVIMPFGYLDYYAAAPFWTTTGLVLNSGGAMIKGTFRRQLYGTGVNHFIEISMDDTTTPPNRSFRYLDADLTTTYGGVTSGINSGVSHYKPGNNYSVFDLIRHVYMCAQEKFAGGGNMPFPSTYTHTSTFWLCEYDNSGVKIFEYPLPLGLAPNKPTPGINAQASVAPGGSIASYSGDFGIPADDYVFELGGKFGSSTPLAHKQAFRDIDQALQRSNRLEERFDGEVFWTAISTSQAKRGVAIREPQTPTFSGLKLEVFTATRLWTRTATAESYGVYI